nr:hypothetical protein [uncultured Noviherbaspirillum sp.]
MQKQCHRVAKPFPVGYCRCDNSLAGSLRMGVIAGWQVVKSCFSGASCHTFLTLRFPDRPYIPGLPRKTPCRSALPHVAVYCHAGVTVNRARPLIFRRLQADRFSDPLHDAIRKQPGHPERSLSRFCDKFPFSKKLGGLKKIGVGMHEDNLISPIKQERKIFADTWRNTS